MLKYNVAIPEAVDKLLRTTRELGFGEIFGVEIDPRSKIVYIRSCRRTKRIWQSLSRTVTAT